MSTLDDIRKRLKVARTFRAIPRETDDSSPDMNDWYALDVGVLLAGYEALMEDRVNPRFTFADAVEEAARKARLDTIGGRSLTARKEEADETTL